VIPALFSRECFANIRTPNPIIVDIEAMNTAVFISSNSGLDWAGLVIFGYLWYDLTMNRE